MNNFIKNLVTLVYFDFVYPMAKKYVESTDNKFDDQALYFLTSFMKHLLKELK